MGYGRGHLFIRLGIRIWSNEITRLIDWAVSCCVAFDQNLKWTIINPASSFLLSSSACSLACHSCSISSSNHIKLSNAEFIATLTNFKVSRLQATMVHDTKLSRLKSAHSLSAVAINSCDDTRCRDKAFPTRLRQICNQTQAYRIKQRSTTCLPEIVRTKSSR